MVAPSPAIDTNRNKLANWQAGESLRRSGCEILSFQDWKFQDSVFLQKKEMFSNSCPRNRFRVVCLPTFAFDDNRQPLEDQAVASLDVLVDDCLLRLFAEFRLAEQLVLLRAVCRRWRRLLETTTLASGAGPGTSVKLFGCSEAGNIRDYCRAVTATFSEHDQQEELAINGDELMVKAGLAAPNLLRPLYNQLSTVLPNLRQLTVWFERDSPFRELPALLEADGLHHLNRLTLLGQIRNFNPLTGEERFLERLCRALNGSQHHRKHLAQLDLLPVNLLRSREAVDLVVTELRDLLPRLTGLSLKLFGCRPELGPLLRLLSSGKEGQRLRSLRLESLFFFDGEELENDLLANRRLTASLEELRVSGVGRHFLRFIGGSGEHFSSLKRLSLGFSGLVRSDGILF